MTDRDASAVQSHCCSDLLAAYAQRGEDAAVDAVFHADAIVERIGWGAERNTVSERLVGRGAIAAWLARTPQGASFELRGAPSVLGSGVIVVRYSVCVDGFIGGGHWAITLGSDQRIVHLVHQPDDLDAKIQDPVWQARVEDALRYDTSLAAVGDDRPSARRTWDKADD
jgi:hypothetical protein